MKLFVNASRVDIYTFLKLLSSIKYEFNGNNEGEFEGDDGMNWFEFIRGLEFLENGIIFGKNAAYFCFCEMSMCLSEDVSSDYRWIPMILEPTF